MDDCISRLTVALESFNVGMDYLLFASIINPSLQFSNALYTTEILGRMQSRLQRIHNLTQVVADQQRHISQQVTNLDMKVDSSFSSIMNALEEKKAQPGVMRQQMPLTPRVFHGRDGLVQEIASWLIRRETSRICILGPGGAGKTSVSLAVVHSQPVEEKFGPSNRFWIPCLGATSSSFFLDILYVHLQITRDTKNPLDDIIFELGSSITPKLILLDNFETPWNLTDGSQQAINNIIYRLSKLEHIALLVTMRGTNPPSEDIVWQHWNLTPIDLKASRQIFQDIYPTRKHNKDLDRLLEAIGYMPFAVTLMAKIGKEAHATPAALLEGWSQAGTNMISSPTIPEQNMNRSIGLSVDSDMVKGDPDAITLLATLSILPAGTSQDRLRLWTPPVTSELTAIATLSKAALIVVNERSDQNSPILSVLPVVQSYMRVSKRIPDTIRRHVKQAYCQYVLHHACRRQDPDFKAHSKALQAEEVNIQSILFELQPHATLAHNQELPMLDISKSLLAFTKATTN